MKITKNDIDSINYGWFKNKLNDDFCLEVSGNSKVIFGYNGIGKTTIFKILKNINNNDSEFLSYTDDDSINFKESERSIVISIHINEIEKLENERNGYLQMLNPMTLLRDSGIKNKQISISFSQKIQDARKSGVMPKLVYNQKLFAKEIKKYKNIRTQVLANVYAYAANVSNVKKEIKSNANMELAYTIFSLRNFVNKKSNICPACDSKVSRLYDKLSAKIEKLSSTKSELIEELSKHTENINEQIIDEYVDIAEKMKRDESFMFAYMFSGGNLEIYKGIVNAQNNLDKVEQKLTKLKKIAKEKFETIKKEEKLLREDIYKYFKIDEKAITFDKESYSIKINFPRDISTYSTGEFNLIAFLYHIYSFIGSEKHTLILDDPVSSLDISNHYKIAFEIVKNSTANKNLIVLTHSTELINAINSQYPGKFEFYYLDELNQKIYIENITYSALSPDPNIISLRKISNSNNFVKALIDRENGNEQNINVFHYNTTEFFINDVKTELSNHKLASLIDNFTNFQHIDFYADALVKIKYMSALRIWLEKQIYDLLPNNEIKRAYLSKKSISDKVNLVFPRDGSNPYNISGFTREDIMSKKVMLNQCVHYYSQISPMAYAINLSFDQISNEINEFRNMFGKPS